MLSGQARLNMSKSAGLWNGGGTRNGLMLSEIGSIGSRFPYLILDFRLGVASSQSFFKNERFNSRE